MKPFTLIIAIFGLWMMMSCREANSSSSNESSYQEKVISVEEIERSQPITFLTAEGDYKENFLGTKFKVQGTIINSATLATFKDVLVRVSYYSKTKTDLGSKDYTIYDFFPPHSTTPFELEIDTYREVNSIRWDVISALAK